MQNIQKEEYYKNWEDTKNTRMQKIQKNTNMKLKMKNTKK